MGQIGCLSCVFGVSEWPLILVRTCWQTPQRQRRNEAIAFDLEDLASAPFADLMIITSMIEGR